MAEQKLIETEKFILEEVKKNNGWSEVKVKDGYIIEGKKKVEILINRKKNS